MESQEVNNNQPTIEEQQSEDITEKVNDKISISVVNQSGQEVFFKVRTTTLFKKIFEAYCQKLSIPTQSIRFLFDGSRINPEDSPESLNMEDNDVVDALLEQTGGF